MKPFWQLTAEMDPQPNLGTTQYYYNNKNQNDYEQIQNRAIRNFVIMNLTHIDVFQK